MDLRFQRTSESAALYESVYSVLAAPDGRRALWVRTTVKKRPGEPPTGALWVTWFGEDGVRAAKTSPLSVCAGGHGIEVGDATQGPEGSHGRISEEGMSAAWDVTFDCDEEPLRHLRPALLYGAPLPRTKSTSLLPQLRATGSLVLDGETVDLTGWTGMLGHNWGSEHAARWIWLRAAGLGDDGRGWLDAVLARVRVGPVLAPWTGFGVLSLDGARHALGGLGSRRTHVDLCPGGAEGADVTLGGHGLRVRTEARVDPARTVGWEYADPAGSEHEVVNCSVATAAVHVDDRVLAARTAVLELGGDRRAVDVPLQPFPD